MSRDRTAERLPGLLKKRLGADAIGVRFIGGGSFGRVYRAELADGRAVAVKVSRERGAQETEARELELLGAHTVVTVPRVLFAGEDEGLCLLCMTFVEGKNVLSPAFLLKSKARKARFAEAVADGLLRWHGVHADRFGDLDAPGYTDWRDCYRAEKRDPWLFGLGKLAQAGRFRREDLALLTRAGAVFDGLPPTGARPSLIHGDLNIMNIMADARTLELTAFIDPRGTMWADPEYDLFQLRNMWGDAFGLYETYRRKAGLDAYADFRVAYYGAMHECAMRLSGGIPVPLWEALDLRRLKKEMKAIGV